MADATLSAKEVAELDELAGLVLALELGHEDALLAFEWVYFRHHLAAQPSKSKAVRATRMTPEGFRLALRRLRLDDFSRRVPPGDGLVVTSTRLRRGIVTLKVHRRAEGPARVFYVQNLTKDELAVVDDHARRRLRLDAAAPLEHVRVDSLEGVP